MNLRKYISKHFILRLSLLIALVGGAAIFDMYHTANHKITRQIHKMPISDEAEANKTFFCNQVPTFNLKTSATEFSVRPRFACTQDKFLLQYYNLRTFQLMKAEAIQSSFSAISSFHSLPFNRVIYSSPDDIPPLS